MNWKLDEQRSEDAMTYKQFNNPLATSLAAFITSSLFFFGGTSVRASVFDAICGTIRCQITVNRERILTPYGVIPTSRVSSWGGGGKSEADLILGAGATYLLGPIGLLGFAAKTHDYNYALNGYNENGSKVVVRIQFKNKKPAQKFATEMVEFTRLGMNDSRTAKEIKEIERSMLLNNVKWVGDLPLIKLDQGSEPTRTRTKTNGDSSEICWMEKLDSNPALQEWANSNPELAEQQRIKHSSCKK